MRYCERAFGCSLMVAFSMGLVGCRADTPVPDGSSLQGGAIANRAGDLSGSLDGRVGEGFEAQPESSAIAELELRTVVDGYAVDFGHIGAISADDEGRIYVLDSQSNAVHVLGPEGNRLATWGRVGDGPGEFQDVAHTLAWMGGTLVVVDRRLRRTTGFDSNGGIAFVSTSGTVVPSKLFSDGETVYGALTVPGRAPDDAVIVRYMKLSSDGGFSLLPQIESSFPGPGGMVCGAVGSEIYPIVAVPFRDPTGLTAFLPGESMVRGDASAHRLEFVNPESGNVVNTLERAVMRRPLVQQDLMRTWEGAELASSEREVGGRLISLEQSNEPCRVYELLPETAPAVLSIRGDQLGRLWLEVTDASSEDGVLLQILAQDGDVLGQVSAPPRDARVEPYVRGDLLYFVSVDDLDVQSVQVLELRLN